MPVNPSLDPYAANQRTAAAPARRAEAVTPNDTTDLTSYAKALYVGQAGDVKLLPVGADDAAAVTLKNHPVGYLPIQTRRVLATGTTAAHIVALFD